MCLPSSSPFPGSGKLTIARNLPAAPAWPFPWEVPPGICRHLAFPKPTELVTTEPRSTLGPATAYLHSLTRSSFILSVHMYISTYSVPGTMRGDRGRKRHSPSSEGSPVYWGLQTNQLAITMWGDKSMLWWEGVSRLLQGGTCTPGLGAFSNF